jgi:toxin ParE1/3/4
LAVKRLFNSVDILEKNPHSGKMIVEFGNEKIRELIRNNYWIVYHIVNVTQIDILMIHRTERLRGNTYDFSNFNGE